MRPAALRRQKIPLRVAAAVLLLAFPAAALRGVADSDAPARKRGDPPLKVFVARKSTPTLNGVGCKRAAPLPARREPATLEAGPLVPSARAASPADLTQPDYLRVFSPGMPHGHRDPPV
jgi:hypothetical protein